MALRRINREIDEFRKNGDTTLVSAGPASEDLFRWTATIIGPEGTPFEGGVFHMSINIPSDYPFKPPKYQFTTKIWHPNVNTNGDICLDILKRSYSPALTILKTLVSICSFMDEPNAGDPLNQEAGVQYAKDRLGYAKKAREWTQKYAM